VHINRIPTFTGSAVYAREGDTMSIVNWATEIVAGVNAEPYRGTSLIRNSAPLGLYSRALPRVVLGGGRCFL